MVFNDEVSTNVIGVVSGLGFVKQWPVIQGTDSEQRIAGKLHEVSRHLLKDNPPEEEQEPSPLQNILAQARQLREASSA